MSHLRPNSRNGPKPPSGKTPTPHLRGQRRMGDAVFRMLGLFCFLLFWVFVGVLKCWDFCLFLDVGWCLWMVVWKAVSVLENYRFAKFFPCFGKFCCDFSVCFPFDVLILHFDWINRNLWFIWKLISFSLNFLFIVFFNTIHCSKNLVYRIYRLKSIIFYIYHSFF